MSQSVVRSTMPGVKVKCRFFALYAAAQGAVHIEYDNKAKAAHHQQRRYREAHDTVVIILHEVVGKQRKARIAECRHRMKNRKIGRMAQGIVLWQRR